MNEPTTMTSQQLAEGTLLCLWGLITAALRERGKEAALDVLDQMDKGKTRVAFFIDVHSDGALLVGTLNRDQAEAEPLVIVSVDQPPAAGRAGGLH